MNKIKEGLIGGAGVEIPNVIREEMPEFFKEMGYKVGVEIGTAKGYFAEEICKAGLKLYCVDPYISYDDYNNGNGFMGELEDQFKATTEKLKPYDCEIIRKTSMDAVKDFEDESLDFVYIDGNHGFKYVTEDIFEWSKKIKKGGVISGHDYIITDRFFDDIHAKYVVDAYTKAFRIKDWYILGRAKIGEHKKVKSPKYGITIMESNNGEIRNRFRSWMWIKQ